MTPFEYIINIYYGIRGNGFDFPLKLWPINPIYKLYNKYENKSNYPLFALAYNTLLSVPKMLIFGGTKLETANDRNVE